MSFKNAFEKEISKSKLHFFKAIMSAQTRSKNAIDDVYALLLKPQGDMTKLLQDAAREDNYVSLIAEKLKVWYKEAYGVDFKEEDFVLKTVYIDLTGFEASRTNQTVVMLKEDGEDYAPVTDKKLVTCNYELYVPGEVVKASAISFNK